MRTFIAAIVAFFLIASISFAQPATGQPVGAAIINSPIVFNRPVVFNQPVVFNGLATFKGGTAGIGGGTGAPAPLGVSGTITAPTPVTTTDILGVATGNGVALVPSRSGVFQVTCAALISNDTDGGGADYWTFYSTTGILPAGTEVTIGVNGSEVISGTVVHNAHGITWPTAQTGITRRLTLGTTYYFQVGLSNVDQGTARMTPPYGGDPICSVVEL